METTPDKVPSGPLLRRIGDFASWRVTFSYAQDNAKASGNAPQEYPPSGNTFLLPSSPRTLTITRTNPRWLVVIKDVKGNRMEQCSDGAHEFVTGNTFPGAVPAARGQYAEYSTGAQNLTNYSQVDFPDMDWISRKTYKGILRAEQGSFLVFEDRGMTVYIESQTRFPVLWKKEGERRTFEQLPPPTEMVDLPNDAKALAQAFRKDEQRLKHPGPPKMLPPM